METENERENSPKKPRTPADTILEPKSVKSGQDTKDNDSIDSAYQTKLRSAIELATAKTPKNIGKNVNESNLTKQFDDALELDKSTDEDDENIEIEVLSGGGGRHDDDNEYDENFVTFKELRNEEE